MSDNVFHNRLRLRHFTVFEDAEFSFSPGINALVGENGTGKTHLMKALYAFQRTASRPETGLQETIEELFQTKNVADVVRLQDGHDAVAEVGGTYGRQNWEYRVPRTATSAGFGDGTGYGGGTGCGSVEGDGTGYGDRRSFGMVVFHTESPIKLERPLFIPAIDMMGHTRGFVTTYDEYQIDFDRTHRDIVSLLVGPERRRTRNVTSKAVAELSVVLGGELVLEGERFFLDLPDGRLPMTLVAEGLRKVATLVRLAHGGWLEPGATLFWDEPEVNLNPMLMDNVVAAILALARAGVQVFLATHSYTILREIEVQATRADHFRFFSLAFGEQGVVVKPATHYLEIEPNPIEVHAADLYDRGIAKRLGNLEANREQPGLD